MSQITATTGATVNPKRRWLLLAMALALMVTMIDATMVSIALPTIQKDLDLTVIQRSWIIKKVTVEILEPKCCCAGNRSHETPGYPALHEA